MTDIPDSAEIASPCIGVCRLDSQDVCTGCYRTLNEIAGWMNADRKARQAILESCGARRSRAANEH